MRPLTGRIGANGGGKTWILEVFSLYSASAQVHTQRYSFKMGGIQDI
ncbi:hypothetical protein BGS_0651 [Beggiatoa sp. SS]|nr:hypothetical protein BGS_0651 [Beggiatoa sp. SS]